MPENPGNTALLTALCIFPRHQYYRLDVVRIRELVHRLDLLGDVPPVRQELEVPRQGLRVAGDVDHFRRCHLADGRQEFFRGARSRRVHHDDVDLFAGGRHVGDEAGRVARIKLDVLDIVPPCVGLRVPDGGLVEFDADDPLRAPRGGDDADGPGAAVRVEERLVAREAGEVHRRIVEDLGLLRVDLVKRTRRDAERTAAESSM